MEGNETIRKHIKFYGRVQGVGFRYSAYYNAQMLGLTGWVRNEWDGSVEMEIQGTEGQIQRFLTQLSNRRSILIERTEEKRIPLAGAEHKFKVR